MTPLVSAPAAAAAGAATVDAAVEQAFIGCRTLPQALSCDNVAKEEGPAIVRRGGGG